MNPAVVDSGQLDALPLSSPEAVLNSLAQIGTTVNRLAPDLGKEDCLSLQGDFAYVRVRLDHIEAALRHRAEQQAKRLGLI